MLFPRKPSPQLSLKPLSADGGRPSQVTTWDVPYLFGWRKVFVDENNTVVESPEDEWDDEGWAGACWLTAAAVLSSSTSCMTSITLAAAESPSTVLATGRSDEGCSVACSRQLMDLFVDLVWNRSR